MTNYLPTGNEMVSLPKLNQDTGGIEDITFLSMQYKGLIEIRGTEDTPLLSPFICEECGDGQIDLPLSDIEATRISYWIPKLGGHAGEHTASVTVLTPIEERGFAVRIALTAGKDCSLRWGMKGSWGSTWHCVNEDKPLEGTPHCYTSFWNSSLIFDYRIGAPVFAFAPMTDLECASEYTESDNRIDFNISRTDTFKKGETKTLTFFWGLGFEEVAAATSAKEMLRRTFDYELRKTTAWLEARIYPMHTDRLTEIYNTNLFFCIFYSTGLTMDTEELVCATSRSTRYYVSAAYWDRDTLLWAFPAILDADKTLARDILKYVFTRQRRNLGVHSRYIDGVMLEPGFELDELMAPLLALESYVESTGDRAFLSKDFISEGITLILDRLKAVKHSSISLYETFLQPTDDEIVHPYLTYNNVLVWKALKSLAALSDSYSYLANEAEEVRKAVINNCIFSNDEGKDFFAWSVDLNGHYNIYDEPPGSLQLLPYLGFCDKSDPVWINTVSMIRAESYEYSFAGSPIAEIGCAHAPQPWLLSLGNSLLAGFEEQAFRELEFMELDNKIACESVDPVNGSCVTGAAFATCAGFLCHSMKDAERRLFHANRSCTESLGDTE